MGLLVDGQWHDTWHDTTSTGGRFVREDATFRNWITADGGAGPNGAAGFKADDRFINSSILYKLLRSCFVRYPQWQKIGNDRLPTHRKRSAGAAPARSFRTRAPPVR